MYIFQALKKHIKLIESQEKKGDSPAYVPPARSVGRPQRRLQIMRGTQTRVRDWTYLDLPIDADTGERVGKVIFSDDEAEELRVMKDKRPSASSAVGKKRRKRGGKKGGADDSDGDEQDEAMLQEQMLAEAEKAERSKEVEDGNAKIEETTVIDTATTSTSTIEENVPQPGKLVEIQASPSPLALKAVRPPPFFPKAIRASTSPTPVVSQAATVAPRQAVAVPQATVVQTVVAQQVPPQPQPPQAHTVQQTIHIPASALNLHQGHHGGPQVTVVQHPHHVQQIQQQGGQPQQHHQEVVYLLNTGPDGQTTATEMQANEFMIKDMTQKWV